MKKLMIFVLIAAICTGAFSACANGQTQTESTPGAESSPPAETAQTSAATQAPDPDGIVYGTARTELLFSDVSAAADAFTESMGLDRVSDVDFEDTQTPGESQFTFTYFGGMCHVTGKMRNGKVISVGVMSYPWEIPDFDSGEMRASVIASQAPIVLSCDPGLSTSAFLSSLAANMEQDSETGLMTSTFTKDGWEYNLLVSNLVIALSVKPATAQTIASEEAVRIFNSTTKPNWNGYNFETLTGIVFQDYNLECTAYQGSDTQFLVTLSGNYRPNAVDLPGVTRYGSMTFLVDTETCTVAPVEDSGIEDAFEVYISLGTAWYLNPDGGINWGSWDTPQDNTPPSEPQTAVPYLEKVARADQPIYIGPGYDYTYVGTVETAGTYTIVEEAWDREGNLWGRLKSGAGWIDLTDVRSGAAAQAPVAVSFADDTLLNSQNYYHCVADTSEYMVQIAIRATEALSNVNFVVLTFNGEGYDVTEGLDVLPELTPDKPLVADVAFPGDMSAYGLIFTDSSGVLRYYSVTVSGADGTLVLSEYTP